MQQGTRAAASNTNRIEFGMSVSNAAHRPTAPALTGNPAAYGRDALSSQANALRDLANDLGTEFDDAIALILNCQGRVIVSGMGKSGLVGRKLAATLSSTGTPSFFLHPAEALHGDLGAITPRDVLILISNSGETDEIVRLLPSLISFGNPMIAITTARNTTLSRSAHVALVMPFDKEVCPNNLAPTTSTLLTMALGDAMAVSLMRLRDFRPLDFARFHPGGSLGRKLLTRTCEVMHRRVPTVSPQTSVREAIAVMTSGRLGLTVVVGNGKLCGIFTDGDLRRAIERDTQALSHHVEAFMTPDPVTVQADCLVSAAEEMMHCHSIHALVVTDANTNVVGILDILDGES